MDELVYQLKKFSKESETEIKTMQQKENFRRDFIGNLAHELKTPLFTSQSYLLTLIDGALKDENINLKYLKIAEKSIERLIFIVKDLDLITKLESDDLKLEKSTFNIISLVNNVFEMLEIQSGIKKISFSSESLLHMFGLLQKHQETFKKTGGSHAAGIFDKQFQLLTIREDIGRHNAVDKCVGSLLQKNSLKNGMYLLVSGRVSYEIVSKAFLAKIQVIVAVSACSSMAVDFAKEFGICLIGFTRENKMTVYANPSFLQTKVLS